MLKIYTDTHFLTETHRSTVFPLLFDLHFLKNAKLLNYYELIDTVENCDIVVLPIDYSKFIKFTEAFKMLLQLANKNDKPIWIYTSGDYGFTNYIKNSCTFRLGGFDSELSDSSLVIPSFINDPYSEYLQQGFSVLEKEKKPVLGFVGHAQSGGAKYVKECINHLKYRIKLALGKLVADKQTFYPSSIKRAQYLSIFSKNSKLKSNFILRHSYRAGVQNESHKLKTTQEFYENIFNNPYTFCIRGVGNFSVRFYETLAVGRIPILLNTDCRLPLSNVIDWEKHCLILNKKTKVSLSDQIINFHNGLSSETFKTMQQSNRDLWLNTLRRDAYFLQIYKQFNTENVS